MIKSSIDGGEFKLLIYSKIPMNDILTLKQIRLNKPLFFREG